MRLSVKVILTIIITVTSINSLIFFALALRFDYQIKQCQLATARLFYKNILTVRKWVSDYNGVYVDKPTGIKSNPYLHHPERLTIQGDTLTLKNPALVTRELSEINNLMGEDFSFHMASQQYLNPLNKPDAFEESALIYFKNNLGKTPEKEFYKIESINNRTYFHYFAPLYVRESCLSCHSEQGYNVGDLRGGISILLSMERYDELKKSNLSFILESAFFSILFLSLLIFIAIQQSVIKPLKHIEGGVKNIQQGNYDFKLKLKQKDEIGNLARTFEEMRVKIRTSTNQLRTSEKKYHSLIENSLEAILIIDSDGRIIECNSKLLRLTGYDAELLKTMSFNQLLNKNIYKKIHTQFDSQKSDHFETSLNLKDGFEIPVEIYTISELSLGQKNNLSFVYVRDLSERKKIEKYSIQTEKMFALGQLSSSIAHEIRNPLFALNNNIDYLNREFQNSNTFKELYPELRDSIERIHLIVSSVLDYTRQHEPAFHKIKVDEVIEKSLNLVQNQFNNSSISVIKDFRDDYQSIEADPHQLDQVFINLFLNAYQAMNGAGKLTIVVKEKNSGIRIQVIDTGIGIPEDEIQRIFDPFYSKSPNGTGLGLAIVRRILDQHNARYNLKSTRNVGTSFSICLPYKQE